MESLYHTETCDGKKHYIYCSRPKTWEASCDFRMCTSNCQVYVQSKNKKDFELCVSEQKVKKSDNNYASSN